MEMASSQTSRNQTLVRVQEPSNVNITIAESQDERTQAVDALERIRTDDDVGDGCAVLEDEDCVAAASVLV
jgi:hypothetical protein